MKRNKLVSGQYNEFGYQIFVNDDLVYEAGNSPYDSVSVVEDGLPLTTIKKYCIQTGKEITGERKGK